MLRCSCGVRNVSPQSVLQHALQDHARSLSPPMEQCVPVRSRNTLQFLLRNLHRYARLHTMRSCSLMTARSVLPSNGAASAHHDTDSLRDRSLSHAPKGVPMPKPRDAKTLWTKLSSRARPVEQIQESDCVCMPADAVGNLKPARRTR